MHLFRRPAAIKADSRLGHNSSSNKRNRAAWLSDREVAWQIGISRGLHIYVQADMSLLRPEHICQGEYVAYSFHGCQIHARLAGSAVSRVADPLRLRLLHLIAGREICVCFLVEILHMSQPKISRHLAYLRRAGSWPRAATANGCTTAS